MDGWEFVLVVGGELGWCGGDTNSQEEPDYRVDVPECAEAAFQRHQRAHQLRTVEEVALENYPAPSPLSRLLLQNLLTNEAMPARQTHLDLDLLHLANQPSQEACHKDWPVSESE